MPTTVAIVDDDNDAREVLAMLLETAGHTAKLYASGILFLADPDYAEIDCLIVDQSMPGMSGVQLLMEMDRRGVVIPTLLITGASDNEIAEQATRLGAMTVMLKPVAAQTLLNFVAASAG